MDNDLINLKRQLELDPEDPAILERYKNLMRRSAQDWRPQDVRKRIRRFVEDKIPMAIHEPYYLSSLRHHRGKPGEFIQRLSKEDREALKHLTAADLKNVRIDGIAFFLKSDSDYTHRTYHKF